MDNFYLSLFHTSLRKLPTDIQPFIAESWQQYLSAVVQQNSSIPMHSDFIPSLCRVWASSDFVRYNCLRFPGILHDLFQSGEILLEYLPDSYEKKLKLLLAEVTQLPQLESLLRQFRRREMLRIAWRDLARWASPAKTMTDLSALADTIITQVCHLLFTWQCAKFGTPVDPVNGKVMPLLIIAMGKLGAYELNFSSDVDLIYCFPQDGELAGGMTYSQFYVRLAQQFTQTLHKITQDGFVFRVDLRLRPHGNAGMLVHSINALVNYYQTHGREWERYALEKARIVNYESYYSPQLMRQIHHFVYRNYVDYSAIESLRQLQQKIILEVKKHSLENNIKRGPGGIREIEFIAQTYKIIRGGKYYRLQERNTLKSLILLRENLSITAEDCQDLSEAYLFLRNVENKIQMFNDQQTHDLPEDTLTQQRLAYAMRYISWEIFNNELQKHRQLVQQQFEQLIAKPRSLNLSKKEAQKETLLQKFWRRLVRQQTPTKLPALDFSDPTELLRLLVGLNDYANTRHLSKTARTHLNTLLPRLIIMINAMPEPDHLFRRILPLIETLIDNSIYLILLIENPIALSQAINLCSASPWIANQLASYPLLLDELLDPKTLFAPPTLKNLRQLLQRQLRAMPDPDLEQQIQVIRWFKQAHMLRVAAADITGMLALMRVSDYLTDIATVVIDKIRELILQDMIKMYGAPQLPVADPQHGFCVVAYGKLGGIELNYSSDLDLVFLHPDVAPEALTNGENPITNQQFYMRLAQRMIQTLSQTPASGFLYKVDLRLRPSGQAGLVVSSLTAFAAYQNSEAWTWEHQALVRSRPIGGSISIGQQFLTIRHEILAQRRSPNVLLENIAAMREKMRLANERRVVGKYDLKQGRGGVVDIEFIAQYAVLRWGTDYPSLLEYPDNIRIFERVGMEGLMRMKDIHILTEAYKAYRSYIHRAALQNQSSLVNNDQFIFYRIAVARIWQQLFASSASHDIIESA